MRPIQYAANTFPETVRPYAPRPVTNIVAVVLVSMATFAIFWAVAMVSAIVMLGV